MSTTNHSRRNFLKKAALAGIAAGFINNPIKATENYEAPPKEVAPVFLFQGDSITDGNRGRTSDPNHIMGHGYAFNIASRVGASFPEKAITFYNRGISGNKVTDLAVRWQKDTIDLKPGVLSILIGVNDADSVVAQKNIVTAEKYEEVFRLLLDTTREQLPDCLIVLCEPFILPVGKLKDNWNPWNDEIQKRQQVVSRLSKEYKTIFVPLQKTFTEACIRAAANYWIWDGIHPTYSGHALIANEWLKQVSKEIHFLHKLKY